ncbi:MAG: hypothetical protein JRF65_04695, partial [Deltaproteobacteria bacterium]|nr:hypothetical protein [Deltaproteobacteria bacterium]
MSRNRRSIFISVAVAAMLCGLAALAWGDVYLATFAGVKGPSTGFTNADLNGTYRFRNLEFEDFGDPDRKALLGIGSVTFNGAGTWTGSAQNLDSDGSVDTDTISGTYAMDPSGSFIFTLTVATPVQTWNGHISKDPGRNFMALTLGADLGSFVLQSLVVAVKERTTAPSLSTLNGTYVYRSLIVHDFETLDPDASAVIADVTCNGAGGWTATHISYNGGGQSETGTVPGTYAVNGKSFDFTVTGETGIFMSADLSGDGNTLVVSSTSDSLADGEQFIGTMVKKNPAVTFNNASLSGGYKIGMLMLEDFRASAGATVVDESVTFNGAGGFTSAYSAVSQSGALVTGTGSGVYAVSTDGSFTLTVTSETPNQNYTGAISQDGHVITGTRAEGGFSAPGELFLDMGPSGLYAFDGYDLKLVTALDAQAMAGVDGGIAIGFPGYGLYYYDDSDFTLLTAAVPDEMLFWSETLVADFGIYGVYAYNGSTWLFMSAADPQGMAAWADNIAIYFPGFGVWSYNGSAWSSITPASVEQMVGWGPQLIMDLGSVWGLYAYQPANWTLLSAESPEDMIVWGNKLVADYSNLGMGVWSYDGSTWTEL